MQLALSVLYVQFQLLSCRTSLRINYWEFAMKTPEVVASVCIHYLTALMPLLSPPLVLPASHTMVPKLQAATLWESKDLFTGVANHVSCISNIYNIIHNSSKITVMKQ